MRLEITTPFEQVVRRLDPKFNWAVGPSWGNIPSQGTIREIEAYREYLEAGEAPGYQNFRPTRAAENCARRTAGRFHWYRSSPITLVVWFGELWQRNTSGMEDLLKVQNPGHRD